MINIIYKSTHKLYKYNAQLKELLKKQRCVGRHENSFMSCACVFDENTTNRKYKNVKYVNTIHLINRRERKHKNEKEDANIYHINIDTYGNRDENKYGNKDGNKDKEWKTDQEKDQKREQKKKTQYNNEHNVDFFKTKAFFMAHMFGLFAQDDKEEKEANRIDENNDYSDLYSDSDLEEMAQHIFIENVKEKEKKNKRKRKKLTDGQENDITIITTTDTTNNNNNNINNNNINDNNYYNKSLSNSLSDMRRKVIKSYDEEIEDDVNINNTYKQKKLKDILFKYTKNQKNSDVNKGEEIEESASCITNSSSNSSSSSKSGPLAKQVQNSNNQIYEYYQELSEYSNMQIFSSNSHHELASEICSHLGISLGRAYVGKYRDGEIAIQIMDEVRGRDVYIIHSTPSGGKDVHSRLMELFLFISTLRRSSAKKVTAVIPYLNYSRQTKQLDESHHIHSLGGPEIAILLQACGVDAIISIDLHNSRIEGFSTGHSVQPPVMNINPHSLAVEYLKKKKLHNPVIVSIDNEGGERTKEFWMRMQKHDIKAGFTTVVSSTVNEMNMREGYPDSNMCTSATATVGVGSVATGSVAAVEKKTEQQSQQHRNNEILHDETTNREINYEINSTGKIKKKEKKESAISSGTNTSTNTNTNTSVTSLRFFKKRDKRKEEGPLGPIKPIETGEEKEEKEEEEKNNVLMGNGFFLENKDATVIIESDNSKKQSTKESKDPDKGNHFDDEKFTIVGDIQGCDCILIDDVLDTGEKSQKVAALLKNAGARTIYLYATHAILSQGCVEKINESCIDEVIVTNTIHIPSNICCEKLHILSVAKLVAEGIKREHKQYSHIAMEDFSDGEVEQTHEQ